MGPAGRAALRAHGHLQASRLKGSNFTNRRGSCKNPRLVNVNLRDNQTSGPSTASQVDPSVFPDQGVSMFGQSSPSGPKLPDAPQTPRLHIIWHLSPLVETLPASLSWRNTTVRLPSVCVIGSKVFLFLLLPTSSESHSSSAHGSQTQHNKQGSDRGATLGKHGIPSHVAAR